jgi:hypothetical protein
MEREGLNAERQIVNNIQNIFQWFTQNPLAAAVVFFGGAMVAVVLYTYVYDYTRLTDQD